MLGNCFSTNELKLAAKRELMRWSILAISSNSYICYCILNAVIVYFNRKDYQ